MSLLAIDPTDPSALWTGRTAHTPRGVGLGFPGITLSLRFRGPGVRLRIDASSPDCWFDLQVDARPWEAVAPPGGEGTLVLADGLDPAREHLLTLVRRTESWQGAAWVKSVEIDGELLPPPPRPKKRLLFIGDSITCGAGVEQMPPDWPEGNRNSNARISFGMELGRRLDAEVHLVSYGGRGLVRDYQGLDNEQFVNAPTFFERAMPDDALIPWDHQAYHPDVIVMCLGTNDFNQGIPDEQMWVAAYDRFVRRIRLAHNRAAILLANSPMHAYPKPNGDANGPALEHYLDETIALARKRGDERVVRSLVRHQPGTERDSHPTAPQHQQIADDLEPAVREAMGEGIR